MSNEQNIELIIHTLEDMIGKKYNYGNSEHTIKSYRMLEDKERVYVMTDKKQFDRPYDSAMEFLNQLEFVAGRVIVPSNQEKEHSTFFPERQINASVVKELKDMLLDNIRKIQENKEYIPQAEAVKSNVDCLIDLAKTEIGYMEAVVRLNKA